MMRQIIPIIFPAYFLIVLSCTPQLSRMKSENLRPLGIQVIKVIGPDIGSEKPLNSPRDIAVNQFREIYIADYGNDRVVKLDSNYVLIGAFGGFGSSSYALNGPVSIALDNVSNLYVIDSGNARVIRADRRLNFISAQSGFIKEQNIAFSRPTCIKLTRRGDIFIGDYGLGACYKLDPFFNYAFEFGAIGSAQTIGYPSGIAIDKNENLYVADSQRGTIDIFDTFGMALDNIGQNVLDKPVSIAVSANSGLWVSDSGRKALYCLDNRGQEIFNWSGQGQYQLNGPAGLYITADDTIYLVDSASSTIFILKPIFGK